MNLNNKIKNQLKKINNLYFLKISKKEFKNKLIKLRASSTLFKNNQIKKLDKYIHKIKSQEIRLKLNERQLKIVDKYIVLIKSKSKKYIYWFQHKAAPATFRVSEKAVNLITKEPGLDDWSALNPSLKWNNAIIWTLVWVTGFGVVWATFSRVDESVQVIGKVEPVGTTLDVKVPLGGVISEILVSEGQLVEKGEILLRLDTTAAKSKLIALSLVQAQTKADILLSRIQLGEEINQELLTKNQKIKLDSLNNEYKSRIEASINNINLAKVKLESDKEKINILNETLLIREQILNDLQPLVDEGALSRIQFLKEKQEVLRLQGELSSAKSSELRSVEQLKEAKNRFNNTVASTKIDFSTKIEENQKQIAQLENQINETELTLKYQAIEAPEKGLVFDLLPSAPGYVVNSALPVLKIVPVDEMVARVMIPNTDIGFVRSGQKAKIRIDAFPYNEFGEIEGTVDSIGSDVLEPDEQFPFYRFPVTMTLENPYLIHKGRKLQILSGMSVSANIVLRQRPVISLFTQRILPFWDSLENL